MTRNDELTPYEKESPLGFAGRLAAISASEKHPGIKQKFGQFFTPIDTARFMTGFASIRSGLKNVSILDPGTGTAVLSCALIERLIEHLPLKTIRLVCYEIDDEVLPFTILSLDYLKVWLSDKHIELNYDLRKHDFIKDNEAIFNSRYENGQKTKDLFEYIISNPPFFKLSKEDKRTQIAGPVIFGQPNIYSIFIYISANLLKEDGELLFLIPRSFCSGNYFRQFREKLLHHLKLKHIHLFESERKIFEKSSVLAESVIVKGIRKNSGEEIYELDVSSSEGNISYSFLFSSEENIIPLPFSNKDLRVLEIVRSWKGALNKYGLKIFAGNVNHSLAANHICDPAECTEDPVLFFDDSNTWPMEGKYLKSCTEISPLLIPQKNYVFLRRYNTNYTDRRISASAYLSNSLGKSMLAVEKHLAYIDRPNGSLDSYETEGLTALLNSSLLDNYLRIINGNINLSLEELGDMPLPPLDIIREVGKRITELNSGSQNSHDQV